MSRSLVYFVSDVHLGLRTADPAEREERFVSFLRKIQNDSTKALYLLGDIWDFWYEYRDVVPRHGARVIAQLISLMDSGIEVCFCPGNHDIWTFSFFESLGMRRIRQPYRVEIGGKQFCLGHGDGLGGAGLGYRLLQKIFHNKVAQRLFSTLHPWFAFRLGLGWSGSNRVRHKPYRFRGEQEPLYRFALEESAGKHVDYFVFGHFHDAVDMTLPDGARLIVLNDWMDSREPYGCFNGVSFELHS